MELLLKRVYTSSDYTIGRLYYKGQKLCDTLEPPSVGLKKESTAFQVMRAKKRFGVISIPPGIYQLLITKSPKFKQWLPLLMDVPGFSGIRIHPGNFPTDTQGCILPGWNVEKGQVLGSKDATKKIIDIMTKLKAGGKSVMLRIENP